MQFANVCKITAQLLKYILRYCIKNEDALFSFSPRNGISHKSFTLLIICYFRMTNTSLFCQVVPSKTANPFFHLFIHLFIYIYLFVYLFNFGKEFYGSVLTFNTFNL